MCSEHNLQVTRSDFTLIFSIAISRVISYFKSIKIAPSTREGGKDDYLAYQVCLLIQNLLFINQSLYTSKRPW